MQGQNKHHLNLNMEEDPKVTGEQLKRQRTLNTNKQLTFNRECSITCFRNIIVKT